MKIVKIVFGLLIVVAMAGAGVFGTDFLLSNNLFSAAESNSEDASSQAPTRVSVTAPEVRAVDISVSVVGRLRPIRSVELSSSVDGRVTAVPIQSGAEVTEGDLLLQLDDRAEQAALSDAEARLTAAEEELDRFQELEDEGVSSEARLETARVEFEQAQAAVRSARAALDDRSIEAPFAGTVGLVEIEPGAFLAANTAVTSLSDLTTVEVAALVPERYFSQTAPGQTVRITVPSYPDQTFEGEVMFRAPEIEDATQSFAIRAEIDNAERLLAGGMFANASLIFGTRDSLAVPDDAIISEGLSTYVYTVVDGQATRMDVSPGLSIGSLTVIEDGLEADSRVVTAGWDRLSDGDPVRIDGDSVEEGLQ